MVRLSKDWHGQCLMRVGIGLGFAEELAYRGFTVILHDRNSVKLEGCKKQLQPDSPVETSKVDCIEALRADGASVSFGSSPRMSYDVRSE